MIYEIDRLGAMFLEMTIALLRRQPARAERSASHNPATTKQSDAA